MIPGASMVAMSGAKRVGDKNLSGTAGAPNQTSDFGVAPDTVTCGWSFNSDGSVDRTLFGGTFEWSPVPDEWYDPNGSPDTTYYIRATLYSGASPTSGDTVGSILALSSDREWVWSRSSVGIAQGTLLIEIFDDGSGTTLLASGYYRGTVQIEP